MLSSLTIKNYAIIKNLEVNFEQGFCVLTGETGAGKSIIMGALALILGQRADTSVLHNNQNKCIVEGKFILTETKLLEKVFEHCDLDFDLPVILRREIAPSGKSRAFINDTPVQLQVMREIGLLLIDVHSQHSNLELGKRKFQLNVIDWYGAHSALLNAYTKQYSHFRNLKRQHNELVEKANQSKADLDYYQFQFTQLDEAALVPGEQEEFEQEQEMLSHSEEIKTGLSEVYQLLDSEEQGIIPIVKNAANTIQKLVEYLPEAGELSSRLESQYLEMRDIADECEQLALKTEHDPARLEFINERLNTIFSLQQKHRVDTVEQLIALRDDFDSKIQESASFDDELLKLESEIAKQNQQLAAAANELHLSRKKLLIPISTEIARLLEQLGMPNAVFSIDLIKKTAFGPDGIDEVAFMFSANKGVKPEEINKVASGGELSRLMLAIKTVVAKSKTLPAIIFDEIDTGISGEIASKMGNIMQQMSKYMQVITITHLPQIASKGSAHFQVYKNENDTYTETSIRKLNHNERVAEIAKMLSGEATNNAAIDNARVLLAASLK